MESNVFVNNHVINTKQGKSNNEFQLVINLFDKKGEEFEFCSSFMKTEQFSSYENSVLKALNSKNWLHKHKHAHSLTKCSLEEMMFKF